jgi:hypothetical protein
MEFFGELLPENDSWPVLVFLLLAWLWHDLTEGTTGRNLTKQIDPES